MYYMHVHAKYSTLKLICQQESLGNTGSYFI